MNKKLIDVLPLIMSEDLKRLIYIIEQSEKYFEQRFNELFSIKPGQPTPSVKTNS